VKFNKHTLVLYYIYIINDFHHPTSSSSSSLQKLKACPSAGPTVAAGVVTAEDPIRQVRLVWSDAPLMSHPLSGIHSSAWTAPVCFVSLQGHHGAPAGAPGSQAQCCSAPHKTDKENSNMDTRALFLESAY
jgi:hypothetical protein